MRSVLAVLVLIVTAYFMAGFINTDYVLEKDYHVVRKGETLWEIAGENMSKQDRHEDIRNFIDDIRKANGLEGRYNLVPGQGLEIPLYKEIEK